MLRHSLCLSGLLAIGFLAGCSGGPKPEVVPPLEPVSGKVTMNGKPGDGIAVTFFPAENNKGNPASASTDANGNYTLAYRTGAAGVPAGDYVVMFSKLTQPDGSPIPADKTAADVMAVDQIPEQYRARENPQYTISVPKGGKTFDFEIKTK